MKNKGNKLIIPPALRQGGNIAICTPASRISVPLQWSDDAYTYIRSKGFRVTEHPSARLRHGHTAGTISQRVDALHELFLDPEVDAIMAFWGGLQSHQLLEYLDYDLIRSHPKIFVGYSDITALNIALFVKAGLVSFSGPGGISFCSLNRFEYTWDHFLAVVSSTTRGHVIEPSPMWSDDDWWKFPDRRRRKRPSNGWKVFTPGKTRGTALGGNLGTLLLLAGTAYWPNFNGAVLFVEEDGSEKSGTIDRRFTQLRHLGVFDQIAGLVIGRFPGEVGFSKKDSLELILKDALRGCNFPVLYDVDFGHAAPLFTFPIGIEVEITTKPSRITIRQAAVESQ